MHNADSLIEMCDVDSTMKECVKCHKEKILEEFYLNSRTSDGRDSRCKDCKDKATIWVRILRKVYDNYDEGKCEITGSTEKIELDHCHETGRFRGYLNYQINRAIGQFGDSLDSMRKAYFYILNATHRPKTKQEFDEMADQECVRIKEMYNDGLIQRNTSIDTLFEGVKDKFRK